MKAKDTKKPPNKPTFYLCGPMTGLKSSGIIWRQKLSFWLSQHGFQAILPVDGEAALVEKHGVDFKQFQKKIFSISPTKRKAIFKELREKDFNQIKSFSDALVVHFPKETAGTCCEVDYAARLGKKIHLVTKKKNINPWIESCLTSRHKNFKKLKSYLLKEYRKDARSS